MIRPYFGVLGLDMGAQPRGIRIGAQSIWLLDGVLRFRSLEEPWLG